MLKYFYISILHLIQELSLFKYGYKERVSNLIGSLCIFLVFVHSIYMSKQNCSYYNQQGCLYWKHSLCGEWCDVH